MTNYKSGIISETKIKRSQRNKKSKLDNIVCGCDTVTMDKVVCGCDTVSKDNYHSSYIPHCGDCTHGECMCYRD